MYSHNLMDISNKSIAQCQVSFQSYSLISCSKPFVIGKLCENFNIVHQCIASILHAKTKMEHVNMA